MPSINDTSATKALNEDQYINKVYDNVIDKQKNLLKENYTTAGTELDAEKQSVQQQTNTNLGRINVEAQKIQQAYKGPKLSPAAQQQAALSMDNQQKKNVSTIKSVQSEADAEILRHRKLLGEQYAAAIKKAQADNDMARAQQLYEAAKAEEEKLLSLKKEAGNLLAAKGDNSILTSLLGSNPVTRDTTSETWNEVLKNESGINGIYDAAIESDRQAAIIDRNEALSLLASKQADAQRQTDKRLNDAYVDSLKKAKNYNETQTAYGLGSGSKEQANIARNMGLLDTLAGLRGVQMGADAETGMERYSIGERFRKALFDSLEGNEKKRAEALIKAAEEEEQKLIDLQKSTGTTLASQNNYSILGKLYGLTQDQIDRLQGTGAYAPSSGGGSGGSRRGGGGGEEEIKGYYSGWSNKTLQNNANKGIAQYEKNSKPLSTAAKKELQTPTVVRGKTSSQKYVM